MADSSAPSILDSASKMATAAAQIAPLLTNNHAADDDDDNEKELELETPFGKVELEWEPKSSKKEQRKQRKEERSAARALKRAAKDAAKKAKDAPEAAAEKAAEVVHKSSGRGGRILLILAVIVAVSAFVAVAWWLFARPPDDVFNEVPDEFRSPEDESASEPPQGFAAKAKQRLRSAIRAGQRASRQEQIEQEKRVRELTGQS